MNNEDVKLTTIDILQLLQHSATRQDIHDVRQELKDESHSIRTEMKAVRDELKTEIQTVRDELKTEIQTVRDELKTEIQTVRDELKTEMQAVRDDFKTEIRAVRNEFKSEIQALRAEMQTGFQTIREEMREDRKSFEAKFAQVFAKLGEHEQAILKLQNAIARTDKKLSWTIRILVTSVTGLGAVIWYSINHINLILDIIQNASQTH